MKESLKKEFTNFINEFRDERGEKKYRQLAHHAINNNKKIVVFGFKDLIYHNNELATLIFNEYYKYESIINAALTQYMHEEEKNMMKESGENRGEENKDHYECSFDNGFDELQDQSVRGLKCGYLGKLIKLRGTVTRTSEVRPELKVGVFKCRTCGKYSKEVPQQFKYT